MSGHLDVLLGVAITILLVMMIAWVLGRSRSALSIAQVFWGVTLVLVVWVATRIGDGNTDRRALLSAMVTIWGIRLTGYAWWRSRGLGEDPQSQSLRRYSLQGLLIFVVSLPLQLAVTPIDPALGWVAVAGVVVWGVGLFLGTIGDAHLTRFRHLNSIGDGGVWWGIFLVTAETNDAWFGLIGPMVMTYILLRFRTSVFFSQPPSNVNKDV